MTPIRCGCPTHRGDACFDKSCTCPEHYGYGCNGFHDSDWQRKLAEQRKEPK